MNNLGPDSQPAWTSIGTQMNGDMNRRISDIWHYPKTLKVGSVTFSYFYTPWFRFSQGQNNLFWLRPSSNVAFLGDHCAFRLVLWRFGLLTSAPYNTKYTLFDPALTYPHTPIDGPRKKITTQQSVSAREQYNGIGLVVVGHEWYPV